jgi:hypothetical protein
MASHPTKSFEKPTVEDRFRVLPSGVDAVDISNLARAAGLSFLAGAAFGWSRVQLQHWMILDYQAATAWTRMGDGRAPIDPTEGLDDVRVDVLIDRTRRRVMAMIDKARHMWSGPAFVRDMIDGRLVVAVYDRRGGEAYAPACHADMGLVHRVTSLFVADYLARPSDFDRISSCDGCGEVAIGTRGKHPAWCAEPPKESGIVERSRVSATFRRTLRGVG